MAGPKVRLDQLLVKRGLFPTRERAQAAVMAGLVRVGGVLAAKAGLRVDPGAVVEVNGPAHPYVSRGGVKLEKALREFGIDVRDRVAIDAGSSTGGFTDCLLRAGARLVYAVDVGYGQLHWTLRQNPRVVVRERTNVRYLEPSVLGPGSEPPDLAVVDVSFISLAKVLPALLGVLVGAREIVALVKPQFEAGPDRVGKKGVVRDPAVHGEVLSSVIGAACGLGLRTAGITHSPVRGPEGNIEYLVHLVPGSGEVDSEEIAAVVQQAHQELG